MQRLPIFISVSGDTIFETVHCSLVFGSYKSPTPVMDSESLFSEITFLFHISVASAMRKKPERIWYLPLSSSPQPRHMTSAFLVHILGGSVCRRHWSGRGK